MKKENLEMLSKPETIAIIDDRFTNIMRGSLYTKCKILLEKDRALDLDDLKQNAWLSLVSSANKDNKDLTRIWPLAAFAIETFRRRLFVSIRDRFYVKKRSAFVDSLDAPLAEDSDFTLADKILEGYKTELSDEFYDYLGILKNNYYVVYNTKLHRVKLSSENYVCYGDFDIIFPLNNYLYDRYLLTKKELISKYSSENLSLTSKMIKNINEAIERLINIGE